MIRLQTIWRRAQVFTVALAMALIGTVSLTQTASAASGNIYIKFGNWHCLPGDSVVFVNGATVMPSGSTVYSVPGSKISVWVWFNTHNDVTATLTCKKTYWWMPWYATFYYVNVYGQGFWPTTPGQTMNL